MQQVLSTVETEAYNKRRFALPMCRSCVPLCFTELYFSSILPIMFQYCVEHCGQGTNAMETMNILNMSRLDYGSAVPAGGCPSLDICLIDCGLFSRPLHVWCTDHPTTTTPLHYFETSTGCRSQNAPSTDWSYLFSAAVITLRLTSWWKICTG